jgi:S1-C subfamily serine protease
MHPVVRCSILLLLIAMPDVISPSNARADRPIRAWPVSQRTRTRFTPQVKKNLSAIGHIVIDKDKIRPGSGTGTLIHVDGTRGYILTNSHVLNELADKQVTVDFHPHGAGGAVERAPVMRVVTHTKSHADGVDYSLLEVDLSNLSMANIGPANVSLSGVKPEARVYTAGYSAADQMTMGVMGLRKKAWALRTGGVETKPMVYSSGHIEGNLARVGTAPGGSGSPLFNAEDHGMAAVVWGVSRSDSTVTHYTDISVVMRDLFKKRMQDPAIKKVLRAVSYPGIED